MGWMSHSKQRWARASLSSSSSAPSSKTMHAGLSDTASRFPCTQPPFNQSPNKTDRKKEKENRSLPFQRQVIPRPASQAFVNEDLPWHRLMSSREVSPWLLAFRTFWILTENDAVAWCHAGNLRNRETVRLWMLWLLSLSTQRFLLVTEELSSIANNISVFLQKLFRSLTETAATAVHDAKWDRKMVNFISPFFFGSC